ncbi:hypothetical protein [Cytobacillus sp. IB215665]|uniref:hypothetical protein n=1 Tax=Cytobacillus sp. IB215665 TaxID=3097357 RepID=UPI002A0E6A7B|nr:hypothetical protein [Cytobacillus sp. IB215665]MDX8366594.1 hypothetical protein [Cytobacillus sp. IB215665]
MEKTIIKITIGLLVLTSITLSYLLYEKNEREKEIQRDLYIYFIDNEIFFANQFNVLSDSTAEEIMDSSLAVNNLKSFSYSLLEYTNSPIRSYLGFPFELKEFMYYTANEVNLLYDKFITKTLTQDDLITIKELNSAHQSFIEGMDLKYLERMENSPIKDIREDLQKRINAINDEGRRKD